MGLKSLVYSHSLHVLSSRVCYGESHNVSLSNHEKERANIRFFHVVIRKRKVAILTHSRIIGVYSSNSFLFFLIVRSEVSIELNHDGHSTFNTDSHRRGNILMYLPYPKSTLSYFTKFAFRRFYRRFFDI